MIARSQASATLILNDLSNHCIQTDDFHAWTLVVRGHNVGFTLLGRAKGHENDGKSGE